jgi:hypothetical protein
VATHGDTRPVEAWALERLVKVLRSLSGSPAGVGVPEVRALSRQGAETLDAFAADVALRSAE